MTLDDAKFGTQKHTFPLHRDWKKPGRFLVFCSVFWLRNAFEKVNGTFSGRVCCLKVTFFDIFAILTVKLEGEINVGKKQKRVVAVFILITMIFGGPGGRATGKFLTILGVENTFFF